MKKFLLAASALTLLAAPQAHAQLLSGGGLGQITGGISTIQGPLVDRTTTSVRSATRGTARADAHTRGTQNVDRRSGAVSAERSVDTGLEATTGQLLDTPTGSANGSAAGSGNASGSGSANAQLLGTDAAGALVGESTGRVRESARAARERASDLASQTAGLTGSTSGAGSAAGSGAGTVGGDMLAVAGSGAAAGDGAFAVEPGMPVMLPRGEKVGEVRQIVADGRGQVQQVVVKARDGTMTLPAASLTGSADALVMGEGSVPNGQSDAAPTEETAK
jgi:hypothetical protein